MGADKGQQEHNREWENNVRGSFKAFCVVSGLFLPPQSQAKNAGGIIRGFHRARGRFANQPLAAEERHDDANSTSQLVDSSGLLRGGDYKASDQNNENQSFGASPHVFCMEER